VQWNGVKHFRQPSTLYGDLYPNPRLGWVSGESNPESMG
jgi:hypothetical protein